jgi:hypothetical protein
LVFAVALAFTFVFFRFCFVFRQTVLLRLSFWGCPEDAKEEDKGEVNVGLRGGAKNKKTQNMGGHIICHGGGSSGQVSDDQERASRLKDRLQAILEKRQAEKQKEEDKGEVKLGLRGGGKTEGKDSA